MQAILREKERLREANVALREATDQLRFNPTSEALDETTAYAMPVQKRSAGWKNSDGKQCSRSWVKTATESLR